MEQYIKNGIFVIAEIGCNHGGDVALAQKMIDAAAQAGADAVKFQTYTPAGLVSPDHEAYANFKKEALSFDHFRLLKEHCQSRNILFISTPFDLESADFLHQLDMKIFKISSGDVTHLPLIRRVAQKGKPILLSVGACLYDDIDEAVALIKKYNNQPLTLLHCTAAYPTPDDQAQISLIPQLKKRYGTLVGFSDHTLGIAVTLGAVALGARVIEKHFTIDQTLPGGDNDMSILPHQLAQLISDGRRIYQAIGSGRKEIFPAEKEIVPFIRRSLFANDDIKKGSPFTEKNIILRRPGGGLSAKTYDTIIGKTAKRNIKKDTLIQEEDF